MTNYSVEELRAKVLKHFKVYEMSYLDSMNQARLEYGLRGVKTQLLYVLCNARAIGKEGKEVRKELTKWASSKEGI